jgi:DNA-binding LacI/PurR family transcriptional regulator
VHDVAAAAGVSRGTVSRVLNGGYVSAPARAAIEAAIAAVGYVPNTAARNLVRRRSQAVGFLALQPHALLLEDPNIGAIMLGANTVLSLADHQMVSLIIDSARDTERITRYLSGGFVDGVIIVSARTHDPITRLITDIGLPATFVGHPADLPPDTTYVSIDNTAAAHAITHRLAATGRHTIAMIAAALDRDSGADRLTGYRTALGDRYDPTLVAEVDLYDYTSGAHAMHTLLHRNPAIDGVFAASDALAAGALHVLHQNGRRVPHDVGIVGFDDSAWATRTHPPLSTVHQPATDLGRHAADLVLRQLHGDTTTTSITLDAPIIWRDSA